MKWLPALALLLCAASAAAAPGEKVVVFHDRTRLIVEDYEVDERVVVLRTIEGRRQLVPRVLVDLEATAAANPGRADLREGDAPVQPPRRDGPRTRTRDPAATSPDRRDSRADAKRSSRLSDQPIPLAIEEVPKRPRPLLELGSRFLGPGPIRRGFRIPGGAVWQPSLLVFGTLRTSAGVSDDEAVRTTRWANRLDLFGNLYLTATERFVFGVRPVDRTDASGARSFTGYTLLSPDPDDAGGGQRHFDLDSDAITHLFFEGELGELIPDLDDDDHRALDIGFSVGRQPIRFQEGLLIDDSMDALGITLNNRKPDGAVNRLVTGLVAWDRINRNTGSTGVVTRNAEAHSTILVGVFNEIDWRSATVELDAVLVGGGSFRGSGPDGRSAEVDAGGSLHLGASLVRRIGPLNSSVRALGSVPLGDLTPPGNDLGVGDPAAAGLVLFTETSWTPRHGHDFSYVNGYWAAGRYRAAALGPNAAGPLGRAGILFAGSPVGDPGAISPVATNSVGLALGRQAFFDGNRRQLVLEIGGRFVTPHGGNAPATESSTLAGGARYQVAVGRREVITFEGFVARDRLAASASAPDESRLRAGTRVAVTVKF